MNFDERKSGISLIGDLPWGSHFCQFFETKTDLHDILVPFFKAGLENNEYCVWIASAPVSAADAKKALENGVPRYETYVRKGQIEIISFSRCRGRGAKSDRMILSRIDSAIANGFDGLRIASCAFPKKPGSKVFACYGADAVSRSNALAAYAYPRRKFDALGVMEAVKNHRLALIRNAGKWEVIESTEARTVKDALKRSEEKLRSLFSNMSEGFAYHRIVLDAKGKPNDYIFLEVNDAFEKLTGLKAKKILGKRVTEVLPGIEKDATDWIGKYGAVALSGKPIEFESYSEPLKRWYAVSAFSPHRGFFAVTISDITARKQAEDKIGHLASFPEMNPIPIVELDPEGTVTYVNPAMKKAFPDLAARGRSHGLLSKWPEISAGFQDQKKLFLFPEMEMGGRIFYQTVYFARGLNLIRIYSTDITERKQTEIAFRKSLRQFELLARTSADLLQAPEPQKIVESLCRRVMEHLDCHAFFNFLVDEQAGRLHLNAWAGISEEEARKIEWLDFGVAVCGCAARDGCRIIAENIPTTPDVRTELVKSYGIKAYACHPILGPAGKVIGTLSFGTCTRETFSEDEISLMKAVTDQVAVAMVRMRDEQALRRAHDELDGRVRERTSELAQANRELEQEISIRTLAEKELRESEVRFRTSVESMLDGYAILSAIRDQSGAIADFRYEYINEAGCRLNHRAREEHIGHTMLELLPGHRGTDLFDDYIRVVTTGEPLAKSLVYEDTYGTGKRMSRAFDLQAIRLGDGFAVVWRDVSEQKKAEEALRFANRYNRSLLEASLDPLVTIAADGKITDVNLATEKVTGYSRAELIGTDFSDYFLDAEKARTGYQQVFRDGTVKDYALEIRHKDGRITPVLYNASVYRDMSGNVIGVFAAARDITERRETERRITLTNELLKLYTRKFSRKEYLDVAVELLREWSGCHHTGVRIADSGGNIPYESCAGYSREFLDTENRLSVKDDHCICTRVVVGRPVPSELVAMTPNGSFYSNQTLDFVAGLTESERSQYRAVCMRYGYKSLAVVPIRHGDTILGAMHIADERPGMVPRSKVEFFEQLAFIIGEALFRFGIEDELRQLNRDLEERVNERTAQLASANKELEAFAYSVSHDLRTPLRSIDGFSNAILEDYRNVLDETGRDYFERIRAAAGRMGQLIDALLNLSRVTRGVLRPTAVDLTSLARTTADELKKSDRDRSVEFAIAEGVSAEGDAVMLRVVMENLISNAWKFTSKRQKARIEFGTTQKDRTVIYFVRDNGAGFDMAYANKLFTAFQRLHGAEEFPGVGVGLATVQRIIHRHGGRIWAEGEIDKGATVYFTLA